MPRLANMLRSTGWLEIPIEGDEPLRIEYRREVLTPRMQAQMAVFGSITESGQAPREAIDLYCELVVRTVCSWNLTDDDGLVIPLTAEGVSDVEFAALNLIMSAIQEASAPDPPSGGASRNGSSATDDSSPDPRTTTTS